MEVGLVTSIVLGLVSVVMMVVTQAETYWFSGDAGEGIGEIHMGLWSECIAQGCVDYDGKIDWIKTPEALVTLSLICAVVSLALVAFTMLRRNKDVAITSAVLSLLSGALGLAGFMVFNSKLDGDLNMDWCSHVNAVADGLMIGVAIRLVVFICRASRGGYFDYIEIQR